MKNFVFKLYVAGEAPNSLRAVNNLRALCQEHLPARHRIEIVDVLKNPLRAMSDDVLVTPTLVKVSPGRVQRIIGDLSEKATVLAAFGLTYAPST